MSFQAWKILFLNPKDFPWCVGTTVADAGHLRTKFEASTFTHEPLQRKSGPHYTPFSSNLP